MSAEQNRKTVQMTYEAFNRGEMGMVFDSLSDEVVWTCHTFEESPLRGVFYGKSGVQQFFSNLDHISLERFDVTDIIAVEESVVVIVDCKSTVKATGKSFEGTLVHVMTLPEGKIQSWDEYEDASRNPWT